MKKRTAAAFIAAMTITTLTACGGPKQLSKSVTVELGKEDGIKVTDVLDISKDKVKDVKIDTKKVNFYKEGKYDATLTYDKKEYKVTVKVKDTVAPEATAKENITVQTGTAVHVTDCLDKVTEASGNIKAEFETKPETDTAQGTETTESTEKAETTESTESTDKSSVSSSESVANTTEATDTQSQAIAVGDVNLTSNDEITYVTAGDYDNNIVVTDDAGNETKVPVKISVINPPTINGVTDKTVTVGDTIDYMAGVTATDGKGADITSSVTVDSSAVKTDTAGTYQAAYKVTDANGYTGSATSNVTVNEKPKEEPKQEAADNNDSSNKSDSKKNNSSSSNSGSSKKHHSSSGSASSNNTSSGNGGQSASNSGGSSSGGSGSSGSSDNGGGSSSGGSSSSNITPVNRADVPAGWKLVETGGEYVAVNPNAGKYDTAYAGNSRWGLWANGSKQTVQELADAKCGGNREAALYLLAAGEISQGWFNDAYGQ